LAWRAFLKLPCVVESAQHSSHASILALIVFARRMFCATNVKRLSHYAAFIEFMCAAHPITRLHRRDAPPSCGQNYGQPSIGIGKSQTKNSVLHRTLSETARFKFTNEDGRGLRGRAIREERPDQPPPHDNRRAWSTAAASRGSEPSAFRARERQRQAVWQTAT
jgi:hypothetical protein